MKINANETEISIITSATSDCTYTIVLNACHTHKHHLISYYHEMKHIENGDYEKRNADIVEIHAHGLK